MIVNGMPVYGDDGEIQYVVSFSLSAGEIASLQHERDRLLEKLEEYQDVYKRQEG